MLIEVDWVSAAAITGSAGALVWRFFDKHKCERQLERCSRETAELRRQMRHQSRHVQLLSLLTPTDDEAIAKALRTLDRVAEREEEDLDDG